MIARLRFTFYLFSGSADGTVRVWEPQHASSSYDGMRAGSGSRNLPETLNGPHNCHPLALCTHPTPHPAGHQVAILEGHPEEVYHVEFMHAVVTNSGGSPAVAGGPAASQLLLLVASSESLFVWDVESRRLIQKADAPGTAGSSLTPEGEAGELDAVGFV